MTNFVRHEKCPKCAALGKDRNGNNLGVYSDGGVYCFSCGYTRPGSAVSKLKNQVQPRHHDTIKQLSLPPDVGGELPEAAWQWLKSYSLTELDVVKHNILWSEHAERVVFPIFGGNQELLAWQGRYIGVGTKPKWYSKGKLNEIRHILGTGKKTALVLVEDIVSAIRVSNCGVHASPLFGSYISTDTWLRIKHLAFPIVVCWLDKDKQLESARFSMTGRGVGMNVRSVITDNDPKTYSDTEIKNILTQALSA